MSKKNNKITNEYIQFSKKVTRWGMALVTIMLLTSFVIIAAFNISPEVAATISHLYSAYITIMGVTIGAYQGNSSLEKWTKARYNYTESLEQNSSNIEEGEEEEINFE